MLYKFMDKYIWHDFTNDILLHTKKEHKSPVVVFDIGCFIGNFSRKIRKKFPDGLFFLFDPNPNLKIDDFNHYKLALSNSAKERIYYLNNFFPGGGSSLSPNAKNDFLWNLTRKIITFKNQVYINFRNNFFFHTFLYRNIRLANCGHKY